MAKYLVGFAFALSITAVHAGTYTYMCRDGGRAYPVTVTVPNEAKGSMTGGTI